MSARRGGRGGRRDEGQHAGWYEWWCGGASYAAKASIAGRVFGSDPAEEPAAVLRAAAAVEVGVGYVAQQQRPRSLVPDDVNRT